MLDDDLFNGWKNENMVKSEKANQLPNDQPNIPNKETKQKIIEQMRFVNILKPIQN